MPCCPPDPCLTIPEDIPAAAVAGTPIPEALFPRRQHRRFEAAQECCEIPEFCKRPEAHLDYSVDMSRVLELNEYVICASAWITEGGMEITAVRYGQKGALVFLHGGSHCESYQVSLLVRTTCDRVFVYRFRMKVDHGYVAPPAYQPPFEDCGCNCNFYVDLLDEYVGPFELDVDAEPLFPCILGGGDGDGGAVLQ